MNTIKFAPFNDFVTEQHDVEHASVDTVEIGGIERKFYNPCNLNVFITNTCQNSCDYCINKGATDMFRMSDETYYDDLKAALEKLKGVKLEASITGGEPTLLPHRLVRTVRMLNDYGVHCRTVSTNGIGLLERYDGKTVLQHLIDNGFTHNISISRMAEDNFSNDQAMKGEEYGSTSRNISNDMLRRIATIAKVNDVQLRTSTLLLSKHVNSYKKMLHFVDFQHSLGIDGCIFREVEGGPLLQKHGVCMQPIANIIDSYAYFKFIRTVKTMYYEIDLYHYRSPKTGAEYIVKVYHNAYVADEDVICSLSFNHGILRKGFHGEAL